MANITDKINYALETNPVSSWKTMTRQQRISYIVSTLIIILLTSGAVVYMVYEPTITAFVKKAAESITNAFLKNLVNSIPAILNSVVIIAFTLLTIRCIGIVFNALKPKSQKSRTMMHLIHSAIKYALIIIMIFVVLKSWGVNTTALIASAGALTLIVGLCVKSIADDLVAGVFIVFEGNIEVGDIITVNGFKGTVREVGLRVTKIENMYNDFYVIRNSDLKNYVNNSRNTSLVIIKFDVSNKFSKKEIEKTINEIIPKIKKQDSNIKGDIDFFGVMEVTPSNTTYGLKFEVFEKKSLQSQRIVYNYIKEAFDENGYYK